MTPNPYEKEPDELDILMKSSRRMASCLQIIGILCIGIAFVISLAVMSGILR